MANTLRQPKTISAQTFLDKQVEALKCGLLRKKKAGIHLGSWPYRFVVISSGYIYCYKDEHAVEPKSTFSLEEFNYAEVVEDKGNQWRILSNTKPERRKMLTFACLSETDRKEWVNAVNREILAVKNKNGCETDASDEHYYDDIDEEEAGRSPGPLGLNALLKSKPIKAITHVVAKRYHDLKIGGTSNKESSTKLDTLEAHVSDEGALSQAPEIPPARTLPTSITGSSPDLPPGPVPPRIAKQVFVKEPSPLPPNGLLLPSEEPLSQTTALSPSCPRKNAPPPPKPPRLGNIPAAPETLAQPPSNHAPPSPLLTEPKPEVDVEESVLPPIVPRLPPPRLVTSSEHRGGGECSDSEEHVYVNIDDMYIPYEFPSIRSPGEKTLVDLCLISDPNPNRLRLNSILMSTGEYGTYFVRCSRKGNQKVLAFFSKAHKVNEYKIFQEGDQLTLDQNTKTPSFDTLESLLEFYTTTGLLIQTDEHLCQGIHELVDVENATLSNESNK